MTCTILRSALDSRHLWLHIIKYLEQPYAPDLPLYVDVRRPSYDELSSTVTRAVCWYNLCKRGMIASPKNRILSIVQYLEQAASISSLPDSAIQLAPGGKLIIINYNGLSAVDVQTGKCICKWAEHIGVPVGAQQLGLQAQSEFSLLIAHGYTTLGTGKALVGLCPYPFLPLNNIIQVS